MHTDQPEVNLPKKVFVKVDETSDPAEIAAQLTEALGISVPKKD